MLRQLAFCYVPTPQRDEYYIDSESYESTLPIDYSTDDDTSADT